MDDMRTIRLSDYEFRMCEMFSKESAKSQQEIEFGNKKTAPRTVEEIAKDNLCGKMAEVAVIRMLRKDYRLNLFVNYDVYPRSEWDDDDLEVNGRRIDVKATQKGHFLLLEENKIRFRAKQNKLPNMIIMCRTDILSRTVDIIGCISMRKLLHPLNNLVYRLKAGDFIPGTTVKLQADNYCIEFENLSDIKAAFDYVTTHELTA